ncbi:hypothetical protein [Methanobrevibacter wolinii]|uniref:hypothetical protein n=1 Tax=Methanobrevibacter wolinii TaxID=190977 RepID=UPI0005B2BC01|nr:hypothetical protein [Methanobrevibacter wolinii]
MKLKEYPEETIKQVLAVYDEMILQILDYHYFNFDDYNKEDIQDCLEKILLNLEYKPETQNLYMDLYDSESVDVFRLSFEIQKKINRGEIG